MATPFAVLPAVAASSSAEPRNAPMQGVHTKESAAPKKKDETSPMPTPAFGCKKESFDKKGSPSPVSLERPSATMSTPQTRLTCVA